MTFVEAGGEERRAVFPSHLQRVALVGVGAPEPVDGVRLEGGLECVGASGVDDDGVDLGGAVAARGSLEVTGFWGGGEGDATLLVAGGEILGGEFEFLYLQNLE